MRQTSTTQDIVQFLIRSSSSVRQLDENISQMCLSTLAQYIGWIDINIILHETTLHNLYRNLSDEILFPAVCSCLLEIVKKGMDSVTKVNLLQSINLVDIVSQMPETAPDTDQETVPEDSYGPLLNLMLLELLECWLCYEGCLHLESISERNIDAVVSPSATKEMEHAAYLAASMIRRILPKALHVFSHTSQIAAMSVLPAMSRWVSLMKAEMHKERDKDKDKDRHDAVSVADSHTEMTKSLLMKPGYYYAREHLEAVLTAVCIQMQYPPDFEFDADDEDEVETMEVRPRKGGKGVNELFHVHCPLAGK